VAGDRQEASNAVEVGSATDRLAVSGLGANRGAGMTIARGLAMDPLASVPTTLRLEDGGAMLSVTWADNRASRFPAIWLADNRPESRRGCEGQRLTDALELPETVALRSATIVAAGVVIAFSCFERPSVFDAAWLRDHALDAVSRAERRREPQLWDIGLAKKLPAETYDSVTSETAALKRWLGCVHALGIALLRGLPVVPGTVCEVVRLFGYVRETNYGRLFDVVSVEEPHNLAFTAMALGNHTDNPYRDPVPQLQLLHCLDAAEEGGESVVVDGFAVADRLRREAPDAFAILAHTPVQFRYVERGVVDLRHTSPLIELDVTGGVRVIRYNNRSIGPLDIDADEVPAFYAAYRRFARLLHDPSMTVGFRLKPGDLFIVDNRRVLHGRRGFSGGRRHLQGTYADADSLMSKLRVLESGA
jgi:[2-(trimethylamino)ethyl]phosphonate dioxygenase